MEKKNILLHFLRKCSFKAAKHLEKNKCFRFFRDVVVNKYIQMVIKTKICFDMNKILIICNKIV